MTRDSTPLSAWLLLGFLTILNVTNFVDRQLITSFGAPITYDLGLELWEFGLLTGLVFVLFYTSVGVFLGALADRWPRPRLIAVGLLLWSALTAASGLAMNFWQMAAARVLVGVGEATLAPAAVSMLADVFRPKSRALASGVYYLGIPIGAGLSLILSGILAPVLGGWRECFYLLGGLGIPLAIITWFINDPPRGGTERTHATMPLSNNAPTMADVRAAISPALVFTILGGVAVHFAMGAAFFDPIWMQREHGYSLRDAGLFLGTIFLCGGVTGNVLGGLLGDWFRRRWLAGRLLFLVCGQLLLYPIALNFRWLPPDSPWFPITCFVGAVLMTYFYGSLFATVQDLAPANVRSTIIAILIFSVNLLGIAPGSIVAGALCDHLKGQVERPMSWGLFLTGLAGLLAVPCFFLAAQRYPMDIARIADAQPRS